MQRSGIAVMNLALAAILVLVGPLALPSAAIDIVFSLNDEDENPPWDADGQILLSIFEAAASYWEPVFVDSRSMTVDVEWDNDLGTDRGLWTYDPFGNNNIEINSNLNWWVDPTPLDQSEFDFTTQDRQWDPDIGFVYVSGQWLYQDLISMEQFDWFNGAVPDVLEVGYRGSATAPGAVNMLDLLSTCVHELGHELGIRSDVGDIFPLYPHQVGGATDAEVVAGPGGHIAPRSALMCNACGFESMRRLPSAVDILAIAHAAGYTTLNMPRTEFINVNSDFSSSQNWIGGMSGSFNDATVRHGNSVVNATASADMSFANLTLLDDSWVSTGSHVLGVAQTLTIDTAGAATDARLSVNFGGTVEADRIRLIDGGDLVMYGGLVAAGQLEVVAGTAGQFAMVPGATLRVDRLAGFGNSLQFAGNLQIGDLAAGDGLLIIGTNQSLNVFGAMAVGPSPGGSGSVSVISGGQASTGTLQVGSNSASGFVLVRGYDGNAGVLSHWNVDGELTVGSTGVGAGTMTVMDLATVDVLGSATVRGSPDSISELIVESLGRLRVTNTLHILSYGHFRMSDAGSQLVADEIALSPGGSFSDAPGTIVQTNRLSGFGNHAAFSGSLELGHVGGFAGHTLGAGQSLEVAEHFTVGGDAPATLFVGGTVESGRSFVATNFAAAGSSVTVSGSGARWDVLDSLSVGGTETLTGGAATLMILNNGQVDVDQSLSVIAGSFVTVGDSSTSGALTTHSTLRIHHDATVSVVTGGNLYAETIDVTDGGSLTTSGNATVRTDYLVGVGSGLAVNGNLGVGWSGGTGVGNVSFINGKNLAVTGVLYLGDGATGTLSLVNGGTAQIGQARIGAGGGSGTLVVYRNSSVLTQGGSLYVGYWDAGSVGNLRIENGGAVVGNNQDAFLASGAGTTGTVLVDGLDSRWTDVNALYVGGNAAGAAGIGTLTVAHGGRVGVNQALRVWSTGRVELQGGEITVQAFLVDSGGTFQHDDGTLTVQGGSFAHGAPANYSIDGPSAAELPTVKLTSGASAAIAQTLFVGDERRGQMRLESGATLNSFNGRIGWAAASSEGYVAVDGADSRWTNTADLEVGVRNYGQLLISNSGRVENTVGAIAPVAGSFGDVVVWDGGRWVNSDALYVGGRTSPGGTGTLVIASDAEVSATQVTVWPQGLIHLDGGALSTGNVDLAGGRFEGGGDLFLNGTFTNAGVVAPGDSPGLLSIVNGNYLQMAAATLAIDLAGVHSGEFDRLEIHRGGATLGGGLQVSLADGFLPPVGSVFEILWAEERLSGAFDPALISFPTLPGRAWNLVQRRGTVRLEVLSALLTGDYNGNGVVDAADYTIWRDTLGSTTDLRANGDDTGASAGRIDQADYAVWQSHFGETADSGAGAIAGVPGAGEAAVPEPASFLLCVFTAAWMLVHRLARPTVEQGHWKVAIWVALLLLWFPRSPTVLAQCEGPTIETQPQSQTVSVGCDVRFFVEVTGTELLTYQWRKDGTPIPGAVDPIFSIFGVQLGDAGDYGVLSVNQCGAAMSDTALLTVILAGDYNLNGFVDAADYTIWRDTLGSMTDLRANGDNTGASADVIDLADYLAWKSHFGLTAGGGAATVPEPAAMIMLSFGTAATLLWCARRVNRLYANEKQDDIVRLRRQILLNLLAVASIVPLTDTASVAEPIADVAADFSPTNNPNGAWAYGWSTSLTSTLNVYPNDVHNVNGLDVWQDDGHISWGAPNIAHNSTGAVIDTDPQIITWQPYQLSLHPGQAAEFSHAVWISTVAGDVHLTGAFSGIDHTGTTSDVHILLNETSVFDGIVNGYGNTASFSTMVSVEIGDTIDFAVGYGANHAFWDDSTALSAKISLVVPGDYSQNGAVDAADYTVWRDTLGSPSNLRANGDDTGASAGVIDQADYAMWKAHYGQTARSGAGATGSASAAVPEPSALALPWLALVGLGGMRRVRWAIFGCWPRWLRSK